MGEDFYRYPIIFQFMKEVPSVVASSKLSEIMAVQSCMHKSSCKVPKYFLVSAWKYLTDLPNLALNDSLNWEMNMHQNTYRFITNNELVFRS